MNPINGGCSTGCYGPSNTVHGTNGDDNVHISKADGLLGALGLYEVNVNGQVQYMTKQELENTNFKLGGGDDTLVVDADVKADITADGGSGDDVMVGGGGDDKFKGGCGDDIMLGRGGNDCLDGGCGDDIIAGGKGRDHLKGGCGDDILLGGKNRDHLDGGPGRDYLDGGQGKDTNHGGPGIDFVKFDWADLF
jgi:Ca2+-binding RTX toxin-like protein